MTGTGKYSGWISAIRCGEVSCVLALGLVLVSAPFATPVVQAQTYSVLYTFTRGTDGAGPRTGLIRDFKGNLYGTTRSGDTFRETPSEV
jgi:hypothetical protein